MIRYLTVSWSINFNVNQKLYLEDQTLFRNKTNTGGLGHDVQNYDSYAFLQFSIFLDSETCVVPGF